MTQQRTYTESERPASNQFSVTDRSLSWQDTFTGGLNPSWREDIRHRRSATTAMQGSKSKVKHIPGAYGISYYRPGRGVIVDKQSGNICYTGLPSAAGVSYGQAENEAKMRLVKKARAAQTSFQGSTFIGELAETLRMIRNPAQALRRGLSDFLGDAKKQIHRRRGRSVRPPRTDREIDQANKAVAGTWLEYSFGWTPFLNDVREGAIALAKYRIDRPQEIAVVRAYAKQESSQDIQGGSYGVGLLQYIWRQQDVSRAEVIFLGAVKLEVVNAKRPVLDHFGLKGWVNWVPTVWELIPYSFLVDYFTNVGDIVSAWSFHRSNFAWLNRTLRKTAYRRTVGVFDPAIAKATVDANSGVGWKWVGHTSIHPVLELTDAVVTRSKYEDSIVPTLEFEIPGMGRKWANMSALAAQHRSIRLPRR